MKISRILALCGGLAGAGGGAMAADFSDPTWPCIQRKVERLSMGLMWPVSGESPQVDAETSAAVDELAQRLALRRVSLDDAREAVDAFAQAHGGDPAVLGAVFEKVFKALSSRRSRIISGIGEFSLGQIALSERIDSARGEMETLMAADAPDYDKVDSLEEQVDWDQRIFNDRQKTITYLCETPTLLEKRLYAIAQLLQEAESDGG